MSILIKNVKIFGSFKKYPEVKDVFIKRDKIAAIGNFSGKFGDIIIDRQKSYLFPGFIDVSTTSDRYLGLLTNPSQEDFLSQGVTTIIGGTGGISLAPLSFKIFESLSKWADLSKINFDWQDFKSFSSVMSKKKIGVNFASLVGYNNLFSLFNDKKIGVNLISNQLRASLLNGAFGLSYEVGNKQKWPSEIESLIYDVADRNGVFMPHFDNCQEFYDIIFELFKDISSVRNKNAKIILSHFMPINKNENDYLKSLKLIEDEKKHKIYFSIFPINENILPISNFLPKWAQEKDKKTILKDKWLSKKIISDIKNTEIEDAIIVEAEKNNFLVGKTIKELSEIYNTNPKDALFELIKATNFHSLLAIKNINLKLVQKVINHPQALIGSCAASLDKKYRFKSARSSETFSKFLELSLASNTLEDAVKKISFLPAEIFNLKKRGMVAEGYYADLVLWKDKKPEMVIVNGKIAYEDGAVKGLNGQFLRHNG